MRILKPEKGYPSFSDSPEDINVLDDPDYFGKYILQGPCSIGTGRVTRMTTPTEEDLIVRLDEQKASSSRVYFIQAGTDGPIKIGHSRDVLGRLRKLQVTSPVPLNLLRIEAGGEKREKELHQIFAEARMHGEWFSPVAEVLSYIRKTKD